MSDHDAFYSIFSCTKIHRSQKTQQTMFSKTLSFVTPITKNNNERRRAPSSSSNRRHAHHHRICSASIIIEPQTKIQFPETSNALKLLGVGVREKKIAILNVKVYAVGFYADETKMNSIKKDVINDDEGLLLLNGNFEKEIVIKLNMSVNAKDFFKAMEESVVPRISRIATDMATREDDEGNFMTTTAEYSEECEERALEEMEMIRDGLGKGGKLEKGAQISFTFLETGGEVAMVMKSSLSSGTEIAFKSYELAKALLDVYVGDDPISVEAKKAFEAGC